MIDKKGISKTLQKRLECMTSEDLGAILRQNDIRYVYESERRGKVAILESVIKIDLSKSFSNIQVINLQCKEKACNFFEPTGDRVA